jgi:hypothetical protein
MRNLKIEELTHVYGAGGSGKQSCSHGKGKSGTGSKGRGSKGHGSKGHGSKGHGSKGRHCS